MRKISFFLLAALFFIHQLFASDPPKYIFLFIGDGMGLNQVFLTEKYNDYYKKKPLIFLNNAWDFGLVKTECLDSNRITDSGAGGTAIACGKRTTYGSIGELKNEPLQSIAEELHLKNYKIGIITSVPLNHATPACFYGHEPTRRNYDNLTKDLINSKFDFFAGGGFLTGNADSTKNIFRDFQSVIDELKNNNFTTVFNENDFGSFKINPGFPAVIIDTAIRNMQLKGKKAQKDEVNSLPYSLDYPQYSEKLKEYTLLAQTTLKTGNGFFIMVEGGKIDWACHANDALTSISEVNAFNEAIISAYNFYLVHPDQTLIIVTADHETGGMSQGTGYDEYSGSSTDKSYKLYVNRLAQQKSSYLFSDTDTIKHFQEESQIGWTTNEHTSTPVGIWAIGVGSKNFSGIMMNSDIKSKILMQGK